MAKEALKKHYSDEQQRRCAICGELLSEEMALVDTDRKNPKASGGEYHDPNARVVHPVCHMKSHGIHRTRSEEFKHLKSIIDDRGQVMKLVMKVNNQLLAYKRKTDHLNEITYEWLKQQAAAFHEGLKHRDKLIVEAVKELAAVDPFVTAALGVKGIGSITVAYCVSYIELDGVFPEIDPRTGKAHPRAGQEKAPHASSLWGYVGLDKPSHKRYEKNVAGGGNKTLRTILYTMADSQMKTRGAYRDIYDQVKARLSISEKTTESRNTKGKLIECMWKDAKPSHRHGAALRAVMKHFLADYWYVGRTLMGLSTSPGYAEAMLGKEGHRTINPQARGWVW